MSKIMDMCQASEAINESELINDIADYKKSYGFWGLNHIVSASKNCDSLRFWSAYGESRPLYNNG